MGYNKKRLLEDEDWLRGLGCDTHEVTEFIINLISSGFKMTRKEYIDFIESINQYKHELKVK